MSALNSAGNPGEDETPPNDFYVAIRCRDPRVLRDNCLKMLFAQNTWPGFIGIYLEENLSEKLWAICDMLEDAKFEIQHAYETIPVVFAARSGHNLQSSRVSVISHTSHKTDLFASDAWFHDHYKSLSDEHVVVVLDESVTNIGWLRPEYWKPEFELPYYLYDTINAMKGMSASQAYQLDVRANGTGQVVEEKSILFQFMGDKLGGKERKRFRDIHADDPLNSGDIFINDIERTVLEPIIKWKGVVLMDAYEMNGKLKLPTPVDLPEGLNFELDEELKIKDVPENQDHPLYLLTRRKVDGISGDSGNTFIDLRSFADLQREDVRNVLASDERTIRSRKI
jgi:hypothetical protein